MTTQPLPSPAASRRTALLAAAVCLLCLAPLRAATPEYTSLAGMKPAGIKKWLDDAKDQGYQPIYLNGYVVGDHTEYAGVAFKNSAKDMRQFDAKFDMTEDDCKDYFKEMGGKGFHPTAVSGYHTKAGPRFAAVWIKDQNSVQWKAKLGQSEKEYDDTARALREDGYVPVRLTAYLGSDGAVRYTSLFAQPLNGWEFDSRYNMTADQYKEQLDKWRSQDFQPIVVHVYDTPDGLRFLAVARKGDDDKKFIVWEEHHNMSGNQYQKQFDKLAGDGYRPSCICGYRDAGEVKFAAVWFKNSKW